ncbi:G-protein alpha subunit [Lyophyllum atratum]|nr:G-protein alpha subunit [Lyophyllum atratum]
MGGTENDPFAMFTAPPPNETLAEKSMRERREAEEKRISDRIDEEIKAERVALKKQKSVVKVLLLGQSESGKSTTLKNFRMKYARADWKAERLSWRSVIQLNLIRSIITIVETLQAEIDNAPLSPFPSPIAGHPTHHYHHHIKTQNQNQHNHHPDLPIPRESLDSEFLESDAEAATLPIQLTETHHLLKRRLGPLRRVETDLKRRLGAGTEEVVGGGGGVLGEEAAGSGRVKEFGVRGWKHVLEGPLAALSGNGVAGKGHERGQAQGEVVDEATEVIASCREDMKALWTDATVRDVLKRRRLRIEDSAGFFLNDLDRIATRTYEPSDDDIVRARLRTLGIQEYKIQFDQNSTNFLGNVGIGGNFGQEWLIYDVGGSRTARNAWLPYFEGVNAIIFLAPISCFDERLLEDHSVNRLEDSFLLWRAVCGSKILAKSTIILFLNKCDLLKRKLRSGAQVKTFLPSYGERPNDPVAVVKYLKEKFKDILRQQSPEPRVSYFYATSVTDTKATATTLRTVRDSILREHLKNADFV